MADTKISALPASTTPLAGTETLPIVQSGVTKQVSVANLTAGRAISATQMTLTTGNLIVANGQGIDFSATPGTGTSELLNDYEEGTWTPTGNNITFTTAVGRYTKVGRLVSVQGLVIFPATANASAALILGLPFTIANTEAARGGFTVAYTTYGDTFLFLGQANTAYITMYTKAGADIFNVNMSGRVVYFGGQYTV